MSCHTSGHTTARCAIGPSCTRCFDDVLTAATSCRVTQGSPAVTSSSTSPICILTLPLWNISSFPILPDGKSLTAAAAGCCCCPAALLLLRRWPRASAASALGGAASGSTAGSWNRYSKSWAADKSVRPSCCAVCSGSSCRQEAAPESGEWLRLATKQILLVFALMCAHVAHWCRAASHPAATATPAAHTAQQCWHIICPCCHLCLPMYHSTANHIQALCSTAALQSTQLRQTHTCRSTRS
jgi:hypothetical protein